MIILQKTPKEWKEFFRVWAWRIPTYFFIILETIIEIVISILKTIKSIFTAIKDWLEQREYL